jgi:Tfp pilus assembly protein PilV
MPRSRGHSLVEVLVAGLVLLAGIIPVGAAIAAAIHLATRGRYQAEAALGIMSRLESLRAVAGRSRADCAALTGGTAVVHGRQEAWTVTGAPELRDVLVRVTLPHPRAPVTDSVRVSFRCP